MMKKLFERIRDKYFDYAIVGEYLDHIGGNRYRVRYIKKWYWKGKRKVVR